MIVVIIVMRDRALRTRRCVILKLANVIGYKPQMIISTGEGGAGLLDLVELVLEQIIPKVNLTNFSDGKTLEFQRNIFSFLTTVKICIYILKTLITVTRITIFRALKKAIDKNATCVMFG